VQRRGLIRKPTRAKALDDAKSGKKRTKSTAPKKDVRGKASPPVRSARDRRTRQAVELGTRGASFVFRHRAGNAVIFLALSVAAVQLFYLQVPSASGLRAEAASQLKVTDVQKALRGSVIDRNNDQLAFTMEARALTFQPRRIHKQLTEAKQKNAKAPDPQQRLTDIAKEVALRLNNKPDKATLLKKLRSDETFVYLARAVDPAIATAITTKYRTPRPTPVSRRIAGGQHRGRNRLGRSRSARVGGLHGRRVGRH
jgi:cell division protein FtsI (penicillin-binding protein 3)